MRLFLTGLKFVASKVPCGKRIINGVKNAEVDMLFEFKGLPSSNSKMIDLYKTTLSSKAPNAIKNIMNDTEFNSVLKRYISKNKIISDIPQNLTQEEIIMFMLTKAGVGPSKFAQIISSDIEIMSKFSPKLQALIKKTQSENPFSRTLAEAQDIVNNSFTSKQKLIGKVKEGALARTEIVLIKPLSAGTVGEAYLAKTADGKEVIVKMIKKGIDSEQLELEEQIYTRLIMELAPNKSTMQYQTKMLHNLYKDWAKELDFTREFAFNKKLQQGAKKYRVADITKISEDGACIVMEKAEGVQMNELMKMLKFYKEKPQEYFTEYGKIIEKNPWLEEPEKVINRLPECITKAFDEQFMFMKKGGISIMHGNPHMGNYFITSKDNVLTPVFIDTGNCVVRNKEQIVEDLSFLANYFVGNSKGLAKYFVSQCKSNEGIIGAQRLLATASGENTIIENVAKDIQKLIFDTRSNITDVDKVVKTMQTILENHGLNINPESATAIKAQMQFYTGINEAAALSGRTIDAGTIIKDIPQALWRILKNSCNPMKPIKSAISHGYHNQERASNCIYQFLGPKDNTKITLSPPMNLSMSVFPTLPHSQGLVLA